MPLLAACLALLLADPASCRGASPPTVRPTVGAVPLEGRDIVRLDNTGRPLPLFRDVQSTTETLEDGTTTEGEVEDATTTRRTVEDTTTTEVSLPEGMIPWMPYSGNDSMSPVNLPSALPGFLLPNYTSSGRWLSKDKQSVKIINSRPAFTHPLIPLRNIQPGAPGEEKRKEGKRVKRGSGGMNGKHVSLCGGVFRDLYGVIKSPGFPLYYPNNKVFTFILLFNLISPPPRDVCTT